LVEPVLGDWIGIHGRYETSHLMGEGPVLLHLWLRILLTIVSTGGLLCLFGSIARTWKTQPAQTPSPRLSIPLTWRKLTILLLPFSCAYLLLLIPRAAGSIFDRYLLGLLIIALICLIRYYQDFVQPRLPVAIVLVVGFVAVYGVVSTHNQFAFYRARLALSDEIQKAGVPVSLVDFGWEYNGWLRLQRAGFINDSRIVIPAKAYVPMPSLSNRVWCNRSEGDYYFRYAPLDPQYGLSFDPNACMGLAPFAPITYSSWLTFEPATLYVVNYR
jgi:hypothetical protein